MPTEICCFTLLAILRNRRITFLIYKPKADPFELLLHNALHISIIFRLCSIFVRSVV